MFFTLVPALMAFEAPFTGRSLIRITVSPSCSTVPLASFTTDESVSSITGSADSMFSLGFHSWPHSGHIIEVPVGYPYNDWHFGHLLDSGIRKFFHKILNKTQDLRCKSFLVTRC